jgi:hypothetical protein
METLRPPLKEKSHKSAPKKPENQNQIHRTGEVLEKKHHIN